MAPVDNASGGSCDRGKMALVFDERRPFTRDDAVKAGMTPKMLRGSRFRRLFRGVYVSGDVPDHVDVLARAALMAHPPGAFVSHQTAAQLCGIAVPHSADVHVSVKRPEDRRFQTGIRPHVAPTHVGTWERDGIRMSVPLRTFVELAGVLDLVDLVVAGDSLLKIFGMKADDLAARIEKVTDYHGSFARLAASYLRDGVDSPMESRLRMLLVLAGLPEPEVNWKIYDEFGNVRLRFDLAYPHVRIIVEYDGRQHAESPAQWDRDIDRREEIDDDDWKIVVVTAKGIYREPARTIQRVASALRGRGVLVSRPREDWRPFYPVSARGVS